MHNAAAKFHPVRARIHSGRVSIPAEVRREVGWGDGEELEFQVLEHGEVRVRSRAQMMAEALRDARTLVRKYVPAGVSLADELIADRRREAAQEKKK